jgi:phosphoribosylformylglycinamidine (FGAM) synthase PurS component
VTKTLALEVALSIPDNEALTALATLRRLGIDVGEAHRADVWRVEVDAAQAGAVVEMIRGIETIFNPNKHRLRVRDGVSPGAAEVWIDEPSAPVAFRGPPFVVAGRQLPGVVRLERFVGWRLLDHSGQPAAPELVDRAIETLLCNPAFQRAIR